MADKNFGFQGNIPPNVSIEDNIKKALEYKETHSALETLNWFRKMVAPQSQNPDGTPNWDFKMYDKNTRLEGQSSIYEDFGNFHYGVILKSLGFSNNVIKSAAGGAQTVSNSKGKLDLFTESKEDYMEAFFSFDKQHGWKDNPEDQIQIDKGIKAAENAGYTATGFDTLVLTQLLFSKGTDYVSHNFDKILDYLDLKDYDSGKVRDDITTLKNDFLNKLEDITNNQQNKYEAWENLSPEKKAEWINSGGTPFNYDATLDKLQEFSKELEDKIISITNKISALDPITVETHPEFVVEIVNGVALLKSGQTISHIAVGTKYTTKELLQYNGLTEEQAKKLPVGFEVKVPKDVDNIQGGHGNVKVYEGQDGSLTYHIPSDEQGNIKVVKISSNGEILRNDFDNNEVILDKGVTTILQEKLEELIADKNSVVFLKNKDNENTTDTEEKYSIVDVRHPDNVQRAKDEYHAKEALDKFSKGEDISLAEVIQAVEKSPTIMNKLKEVLIDKGNDDVASWITEDGKFKADTQPDIKERVFLEAEEGNQLSTKLGSSIGGGIGSIIIANNDYSNIEKLAISTSTTVIGQNVGEYLFWDSKNGNGTGAFDDIGKDLENNLQGAVISFAISSFFAKNDTLADILGMDGTFVGGLVDSSLSFVLSDVTSHLVFKTKSIVLTGDPLTVIGNLGASYAGNVLANKVMNWDTKNEAMGANIGSAIGAQVGTYFLPPIIGPFIGSFIGNIVGGIIGGLFGGSKPPPPKAHAEYEFDEDSLSYNLVSSGSSDGGNEKAMIDIGKSLANHLENMFNIPGGQLVNSDFLPDIKVNQKDKTVKINGERGTFDTVSDMLGNVLIQNIPFINVENGDPYILRAINRTNEAFLETDIHSTNRANLEELYENISLASDYSKYKSETVVLVDKNGNLITDTTKLLEINTLFQTIQAISDETQKEKALKEFLEEYNFITQKDYVDKLLKENNPEKQDEIDHWKKVFEKVEELQLDTHHYSEDFNKLNSEISKYNYEQSELKGELVELDYDKYLEEIEAKMLKIYETQSLTKEDNPKGLTKDEAKAILEEIGFNFQEYEMQKNPTLEMIYGKVNLDKEVSLSLERLSELLEIAGIENLLKDIKPIEDAFSFAGKSLNDLQFKLEDGKLYIKTFDKDLSSNEASELSKTFVIDNFTKWDKTNTHIELPDGTKVNLQALLETIGVKEGVGFVDVNEAFLEILGKNETISSYLKDYDSNNVYVGTSKGDTIKAYFGDNLIVTGSGNNTIVTGAGDDIVFAHNGKNDISLGLGNDTVSYELNDSAIYASLESGSSSKGDTLTDVENLHGSKYNDILEGDSKDNTLFGGTGDDILIGLDGADTLDGGDGIDLASYETSSAVEINLKHNYADGGEATGDKFINIEGIKGSKESDTIVGDNNSNLIYANAGDDRVSGNGGDDIIFGGLGNDYIKGDEGNDTLYGEDGDDILIGGAGDDILVGGTGKNMLYGDSGTDTVLYKGKSTDYEVLIVNENTLFVKSKDGKTLDTLRDIEELAFDDAVFQIDYENKTLIKKVVFENKEDEKQNSNESLEDSQSNQAATIATAIMLGTVAAAQTQESSTDEMNYLSDDPASLENLVNAKEIEVPTLTKDNPLYDIAQKIKEYNNNKNINSSILDNSVNTDDTKDEIYQIETTKELTNEENQEKKEENNKIDIVTPQIIVQEKEIISEFTVTVENSVEDESLDPLIAAQITLDQVEINEDNNLYGIKISDLNNFTTTLEVIFIGLPDKFLLSAGEKRADGNWYLTQNDLKDLYMIPQSNNSDDFDLTIKAIVSDTHGRVTISTLVQTITIVAVADTPNLEVIDSRGDEDTAIALNIETSLVDDLGGVDGEESIYLTIENVPSEAVLSKGIKKEDGIWYLLPEDLKDLTITPKLNDADDFTIKVTAYSTESENGDVAKISKDIFVKVDAVADTPNLEVLDTRGDEDTVIALNIETSLVDDLGGVDGEESIYLTIENVPSQAVLNKGVRDEDGIWYLTPNQLAGLTITPKLHSGNDFTIKVTAYSIESENSNIASISKEIFVEVNAVADTPVLEVSNSLGDEDTQITLNINALLVDTDGSEALKIKIENIPDGATLNHGIKDEFGIWHLLPHELNNLTITPSLHDAKDFTIKVTASSTEAENEDIASISKEIFIEVNAVADEVILNTLQSLNGRDDLIEATEDASIMMLDISSTFIDTDGSETVHYLVEGLPEGTSLNQGLRLSDGSWKIEVTELEGLGILLKENSDEDFRIKVSAITTEAENGHQQYTSKFIDVVVDSEADYANLSVLNAKGIQNDFIPLKIDASLTDTDGSETLEIIIENVPKGAILNNGVEKDGKWYLTKDDLTNLQIRPPFNSTTSFELKVKAITTEQKNGDSVESIDYLKVNIDPAPSSANITVKPVSVLEDTICKLDIKVDESNLKIKEEIYLELVLPKGFNLNQGQQLSNGIWKIRTDQLDNLILKTPPNYAGSISISITPVIVEENGTLRKTTAVKLPVDIEAVADEASLEVNNITANENSLVYLNINSKLTDLDGSETLQLKILGVPQNAILNVGKKEGNIWIVEEKDISTIAMITPQNNLEPIKLEIQAITTDSNGHQSLVSKDMVITLNKTDDETLKVETVIDSEDPLFYLSNLEVSSQTNKGEILEYSGANDTIKSGGGSDIIYAHGGNDTIYADEASGNITASFMINSTLYKTDGSEKLVFYIENIPSGFSSNKGYIIDGKLVIETDNFDGNITISYPYTKDNLELKITSSAISTDPTNPYINNTVLTLSILATELPGNDYINAGSGNDIVYGQDGDDIILGGDGDDILYGGNGNDYINGGKGADRIDGGAGDDTIVMDAEDFSRNAFITEIVNGGSGFDTVIIQGNKGVNFDMGLTNIESFIGGDGNDNIIGSQFSDIIRGGKGADTYYTLGGDDIVYIDGEDIKAKSGNFIDTGDGYDKIYIEDSIGVDFDVADTNAEEIISGSGNDILRNTKNDNVTIYGMDGDDIIYGSAGIDILDGGTGNDTIDYSNSDFGVMVNLLTNSVSGGYATGDTIKNFENIVGTKYDDNLIGNNKDNIFYAGAGNNTINGMGGIDTVVFSGSLFDYYNGKDKQNIVTNFDGSATVYSSLGVNTLTNINKLQFDDYVVYIDGSRDNSPFVYNDKVNGKEDTTLTINSSTLLANDFDIEGDNLRIVGVKNASNGTVKLDSNGNVIFIPNENYNSSTNNTFDKNSALYKGSAGFEYIVEDKAGNQRTAYVDVNISAVNDAPIVTGYYFNQNSKTVGSGRFIVQDVDSNVDSISFKVISSSIGYTNIANRTADVNGEFYFSYSGLYYRSGKYDVYSMRPFIVQISDDGNPMTGENISSITYQAGLYYEYRKKDPIVIDLDGDGVEIGEYYYDTYDATLIGAYKDDAILVWDKDKNGTISSSDETNFLGLSQTAQNDLEVLREVFDTNKDGIFDENDEEWSNFALWQDKNMNGLVDDDEFTKISYSNILQLNLNSKTDKEADFPIFEYATYTTKDGNEYDIAASHIDTTMTEDKLSQEDILVLKEAIVLVEQLATSNENKDSYEEMEVNNSIFNDELDEENIA
ncbi:cadherin-like domain-containing protein [Aliarcobacter butzleri]|uniref:cadherin-like domain-containing protein n=1 Tax=Aliarcobacter butzleri TaxID=28197 RepID=UPI001EDA1419|nr:cadherin-like domain-containing protein [Aliarcobacter butzleri]MCG3677686.1 cadherin-like domain-containing protein [Aliarcobacter butzleri]